MYQQTAWIQSVVDRAKEKGLLVLVDGVGYDEKSKDEWTVVFENKPYMLDYEGDDAGQIVAINLCGVKSI